MRVFWHVLHARKRFLVRKNRDIGTGDWGLRD